MVYLTGKQLKKLLKHHKITIRELSQRMQIPLNRIREVLRAGLDSGAVARDWIQGVVVFDPGTINYPIRDDQLFDKPTEQAIERLKQDVAHNHYELSKLGLAEDKKDVKRRDILRARVADAQVVIDKYVRENTVPCYCCGKDAKGFGSINGLFGRICLACVEICRQGAIQKPPRECLYLVTAAGGAKESGQLNLSRRKLIPFAA